MLPLYWSCTGEVACADHAPLRGSMRWDAEGWSGIRPQLHGQFRCEQCPDHSPHPTASMRPPLVLNVDDQPFNLYVRERVLRQAGFSVANLESGAKTFEIASRLRPDVILLDVHLGDADGREVCKQIKTDPEFVGVRVILISATLTDFASQLESVREFGADGFIHAPVDPSALVSLLVHTIGHVE
jgi:CheY-like chemotaxis protein